MRGADGRMDAFKFLLPAVQKISDKLERAAVASDLAGYLGVEPGLVLEQFKRAATDRHAPGQVAARHGSSPASGAASGTPRVQLPAVERILLNALLSSEDDPRADFAADASGANRRLRKPRSNRCIAPTWPKRVQSILLLSTPA